MNNKKAQVVAGMASLVVGGNAHLGLPVSTGMFYCSHTSCSFYALLYH